MTNTTWRQELLRFEWILISCAVIAFVVSGSVSLTDRDIESNDRPFFLNDATKWYDVKDSQVPLYAVVIFGVCSLLVCSIFEVIVSYDRYRWRALFGSCRVFLVGGSAGCYTLAIVNFFKLYVGKLRPDFAMRCLGELPSVYSSDIIYSNGECINTDVSEIIEGRKSYPSAHSAVSICFAVFVMCYLLWAAYRIRRRYQWRWVAQLMVFTAIFPWLAAFWIACTRIVDNKHEPQDINGGAIIGSTMALYLFAVICMNLQQDYQNNDEEDEEESEPIAKALFDKYNDPF